MCGRAVGVGIVLGCVVGFHGPRWLVVVSQSSSSSAGRGRLRWKPCAASAPHSLTRASVAASSTPSVTTRMPNRRPRSIAVWTIAASVVVARDVANEAAVDLELVDGEPLEQAERRVAGTEVIERNADPGGGQAAQDSQRALGVEHDGVLGDFDA